MHEVGCDGSILKYVMMMVAVEQKIIGLYPIWLAACVVVHEMEK